MTWLNPSLLPHFYIVKMLQPCCTVKPNAGWYLSSSSIMSPQLSLAKRVTLLNIECSRSDFDVCTFWQKDDLTFSADSYYSLVFNLLCQGLCYIALLLVKLASSPFSFKIYGH